jgi:hypothetical protein
MLNARMSVPREGGLEYLQRNPTSRVRDDEKGT